MLNRAAWIDRFSTSLGVQLPSVRPDELVALGVERWETMGCLDPDQASRCELDEWPPDHG